MSSDYFCGISCFLPVEEVGQREMCLTFKVCRSIPKDGNGYGYTGKFALKKRYILINDDSFVRVISSGNLDMFYYDTSKYSKDVCYAIDGETAYGIRQEPLGVGNKSTLVEVVLSKERFEEFFKGVDVSNTRLTANIQVTSAIGSNSDWISCFCIVDVGEENVSLMFYNSSN